MTRKKKQSDGPKMCRISHETVKRARKIQPIVEKQLGFNMGLSQLLTHLLKKQIDSIEVEEQAETQQDGQ